MKYRRNQSMVLVSRSGSREVKSGATQIGSMGDARIRNARIAAVLAIIPDRILAQDSVRLLRIK